MAQKFVIASVGDVQLFDPSNGELIVTSKTLTDSGINFAVTAEDIRGGMANALLSQYFHDSSMGLTLTDALFSLEYLALNVGGVIQSGTDAITLETVVTTEANKITVSKTPQKFNQFGTIGWYSISGLENWEKITFDAETKTADVANLPVGSKVCVKYIYEEVAGEQFIVNSAFIPSQCIAVLTLPLFKSGTETQQFSNSSKAGEIQVEIPNFMLSGAVDLALTSSGATTTSLSGNALATFTGNEGCDSNNGYYGILKQIVYNKDEFADVKNIVVADSFIELGVDDTQTIQVYALFNGNKAPKLIENSKLTFTSDTTGVATVGAHTGLVTGVSAGDANIEVVVTDHPTLNANALVTVE